jgi:transposase
MSQRKYYPTELKKRIVDEAASEGNVSAVARRYGINRSTVLGWRAEDQLGTLGSGGSPIISTAEVERMANEVSKLKKMLGERELEIAILRDMVKKTAQRSQTESE